MSTIRGVYGDTIIIHALDTQQQPVKYAQRILTQVSYTRLKNFMQLKDHINRTCEGTQKLLAYLER